MNKTITPRIEDFYTGKYPMPKLYRVVIAELDVLRNGLGSDYGVIFDCDETEIRKVRRVRDVDGWRWQLVREHKDQEQWDYYFGSDRECLNELNWNLGSIKQTIVTCHGG